jgi:hypothetical protein
LDQAEAEHVVLAKLVDGDEEAWHSEADVLASERADLR